MMGRKCQETRILAKMLTGAFRAGSLEGLKRKPIVIDKQDFFKMKDALAVRSSDYRDLQSYKTAIGVHEPFIAEKIGDLKTLDENLSQVFEIRE